MSDDTSGHIYALDTAQKMMLPLRISLVCDQIRSFLRLWPNLLKKSLMENFIFCAVRLFWFSFCLWDLYEQKWKSSTLKTQQNVFPILYSIYITINPNLRGTKPRVCFVLTRLTMSGLQFQDLDVLGYEKLKAWRFCCLFLVLKRENDTRAMYKMKLLWGLKLVVSIKIG